MGWRLPARLSRIILPIRVARLGCREGTAFARIADASPAAGGPPSIPSNVLGLTLRDFSAGTLLQTSQLDGNLTATRARTRSAPAPRT